MYAVPLGVTVAVTSTLAGGVILFGEESSQGSVSFARGRVSQASADAFRVDVRGCVVVPGLINAHDHLHLNCIPSLDPATPFANSYEWIAAMEAHRATPAVRAATSIPIETRLRHGALKNILAGVSTVVHHDPWEETFGDESFPVHVPREIGWCHSLGLARGVPTYGPEVAESYRSTPASQPWVIHLAEGTDAIAAAELWTLDALGCLSGNTVLVHAVGLDRDAIDRVARVGASVIWCPASNAFLLGRTIDPADFPGRLALATDSRLSGARDLLAEMQLVQSMREWDARELLQLVLPSPAHILGLAGRGSLRNGSVADAVVFPLDGEPHSSVAKSSRADIRLVIREGRPVLGDPEFADWFSACRIETREILVDGRTKLFARRFADAAVLALEPGVEFSDE